MKFGQSLADHMVPEWRDQYLDYKLGKKKLKKLKKKPSVMQSISDSHQCDSVSGAHSDAPTDENYNHSIDTTKHNITEDQITLGATSSFSLPQPALAVDYNDNNHNAMRVSVPMQKTTQFHDQTPLLPRNSARRRDSFIDILKSFPGMTSPNSVDTELEEMSGYAKQKFWDWVDFELNKVELFYDEREYACVERFLVLQDQIHQLENQKLNSQRRWAKAKKMRHDLSGDSHPHLQTSLEDEDDQDEDDNIELELESDVIKRNIKFLSFWTKRKLRIIRKFDMPSLPGFEWMKSNGKIEKQYYEEGYEASSDHKKIPYFVAKRMIKKAVYELYRAMELLKSYRTMNRTAFRKLVKKYDKATNDTTMVEYMKKVDDSHFVKSDTLENLMGNIEELYTLHFENGNRKVAVTKLRSNPQESSFYAANYFSGLFMGCGLPLVAYAMYLGIHRTLSGRLPHGQYLLQIWGGFLIMVLMGLLFGLNCLAWTKYKVSYKFIFEFNQRDALDYKQYLLVPSIMFFWLGLVSWFSFEDFWDKELVGRDFPWIFLIVGLAILICPFDIFYLNARLWFIASLMRLLMSGFYPVEFRDFFLGDIFCSLTYSISNMSTFFCLYGTHWSNVGRCGSSQSRLLGFLQCVPSLWRFFQCFRRWADTGDWFPHLANMGKYSVSTLYYISLSLYRIERVAHYKALLIFWASFNSIFSSVWDILMDWSLLQFDSKNFLLRDELGFETPWVYYAAMVVDVILRFQWVFYVLFPNNIQQSAITSFLIGIAELIRRFIWIFFRMENEHATNVHLFRASRDSPLPYPMIQRTPRSSDILYQHPPQEESFDMDLMGGRRASTLPSSPSVQPTAARGMLSRYLSFVSQKLRTAHIKDFQRRKVDKVTEEGDNTDDDDEDDDD